MSIDELIDRLQAAEGEDRFLDLQLVQAVGYSRVVDISPDGGRGVTWYLPNGERAHSSQILKSTSSIDDARALVEWAVPSHVAAIAVDKNGAKATIEGSEPSFARTPAVALCLAAMKEVRKKSMLVSPKG